MRTPSRLGRNIKQIRRQQSLSQKRLAKLSGVSEFKISNAETGRVQDLPASDVLKIGKILGYSASVLKNDIISAFNPDRFTTSVNAARIDELDIQAGAGSFGLEGEMQTVFKWEMPKEIVSHQTTAGLDNIKIIRVLGDSMTPDFPPGQRIMVDTSDRTPSPAGVFVLWDGMGIIIKRVEYIPKTEPPRIQLISANKEYPMRELSLDEITVQGRVIGAWQWT